MNKKIKLITLLLTLIITFSTVAFTAFAVEGENTDDAIVATDAPIDDEPVEDPTDPIVEDPTDPVYEDPTEPDYEEPTEPDYEEPTEPEYTEPDYSEDDSSSDSSSGNNIYSNDSEEFYYEDDYYNNLDSSNQTSTYSESDMYNDTSKVDPNELSSDDWNAIAENLANADKNNTGSADDFNFIKKNTSTEDNGIWMLVTGGALVILSVIGIGYVIVSSITAKKKYAYANGNSGSSSSKNGSSRNSSASRATNDYGDGYSRKSRTRKSKLDDTSDIYVPKSNRNGGSRFKD